MKEENKNLKISYAIYFLIAICFVIIRMLSAFGLLNFFGTFTGYVFSLIVQVGILFGGSVLLYSLLSKRKIRQTLHFYRVQKMSNYGILLSILIGFIVFFLNIFVSSFFNSLIRAFGYDPNRAVSVITEYPVWLLFVNIFFTAVLPAICEEFAHRGMILSAETPFGFWKAIIISSLLFGLLHLNIEQFFYATLIGIFLGYLTSKTFSIIPAMIIHFMNNALSVFLTFSNVRGLGFGKILNNLSALISGNLILGLLFVVLLVILLLYTLKFLSKLLVLEGVKRSAVKIRGDLEKIIKRQMFLTNISKPNNEIENTSSKIKITPADIKNFFVIEEIKEEKKDPYAVAFCVLSFILLAIITIFTFIWGVL